MINAIEVYRRNMAHILGDNDEKVKVIETCAKLVEEIEDENIPMEYFENGGI